MGTAAAAPIVRVFTRPGKGRCGARLGVRTGSGADPAGGVLEPDHPRRLAVRRQHGDLRRIGGRTRLRHTADRTGAVMRALIAGLASVAGGRTATARTDQGRAQGIGSRDGTPSKALPRGTAK